MTHAALALQAAMYSRLTTSRDLTALLGGDFVFDDVPATQPPPYVIFAEAVHYDWGSGTEEGMEHAVSLNIWSKQKGRKEAVTIAHAITDAFQDLPKQLDDHVLVNFSHEFTEVEKNLEAELFVAKVNFRAVTEPNP